MSVAAAADGVTALRGAAMTFRRGRLAAAVRRRCGIAHCPTSNNFLGSGLFRFGDAKRAPRPVRVALATDVGGGTTLSMLATMGEAYKVARHTGFGLTPAQAFWLATGGAAEALDLTGTVGGLTPGTMPTSPCSPGRDTAARLPDAVLRIAVRNAGRADDAGRRSRHPPTWVAGGLRMSAKPR